MGTGIFLGSNSIAHGERMTSAVFQGKSVIYGATGGSVQAFSTDAAGNLTKFGPEILAPPENGINRIEGLSVIEIGGERRLIVGATRYLLSYSLVADGTPGAQQEKVFLGQPLGGMAVDAACKLAVLTFTSVVGQRGIKVFDLAQPGFPVASTLSPQFFPEDIVVVPDPAQP